MFAKAIGNGFPMAAIVGKREVMQSAQRTFISSTYWTDRVGPAAALATIKKHRRQNVPQHLHRIGQMVRDGWRVAAERAGLPITVGGLVPMSSFAIQHPDGAGRVYALHAAHVGEGLPGDQGVQHDLSRTRTAVIEEYLQAAEDAFGAIARALEAGTVREMLKGPIQHTGFVRLN